MIITKEMYDEMPDNLKALLVMIPDPVEAEFAKAGVRSSGGAAGMRQRRAVNTWGGRPQLYEKDTSLPASEGSASRFFYCAKPSSRERNEGLDGFEETKKSSLVKLRDNLTKEQIDYVTNELRRCGVIP